MIDGIRDRRRYDNLHPKDRKLMNNHMIRGDHSRDRFKTPNEIAAEEQQSAPQATASPILPKPSGKKKWSLKERWGKLTPKQKILATAGAVVVVSGVIIGSYFLFFAKSAPISVPIIQKQEPKKE